MVDDSAFEHVMRTSKFSTQPMDPSQPCPVYYAVKGGRDGSSVCTSWEDVRDILTETKEFYPTNTPSPIAVPGSGGDKIVDFARGLIRVSFP